MFTTDHKRIGILYMITVTLFFFVGGAAATIIRLNLITPRGALVTAETYNKLFTAHGIVMVWFFLIPVIPTVLGNFVLPLMIGAKDLAFPRVNLLSWYVFMIGAAITMTAVFVGGVDTGWTFYPALQHAVVVYLRDPGRRRHHHLRVQLDHDRPELRGHPPHPAVPGADLVPAAAVLLVALRHQPDLPAGHAGAGGRPASCSRSSGRPGSASSTRRWAAIRCCSSTCSGSTPTRPSTS